MKELVCEGRWFVVIKHSLHIFVFNVCISYVGVKVVKMTQIVVNGSQCITVVISKRTESQIQKTEYSRL